MKQGKLDTTTAVLSSKEEPFQCTASFPKDNREGFSRAVQCFQLASSQRQGGIHD